MAAAGIEQCMAGWSDADPISSKESCPVLGCVFTDQCVSGGVGRPRAI